MGDGVGRACLQRLTALRVMDSLHSNGLAALGRLSRLTHLVLHEEEGAWEVCAATDTPSMWFAV